MTALDPTARAAAALGVPPDADAAAAREGFLRKLADADFAPPEGWVAAVNRLGGTALPLSRDAVSSEVDAVRDEIDAFAAEFWGLDPDARRAKWTDLHARCSAGPSATFLNELEIGLGLPVTPHEDEGVEALASLARELFVMRPRHRAVRRAEWLANHEDTGTQKAVAARLAAEQPGLAVLDPILFGRLFGKIVRGEAVGEDQTYLGNEAAFTVSIDRGEAVGNEATFTVSTLTNEEQLSAGRNATPHSPPASSRVQGWAAVVIIAVILRALASGLGGPSNSGNNFSPPAVPYKPPAKSEPLPFRMRDPLPDLLDDPNSKPTVGKYTPEQVLSYLQYRPGSKDPAPPGYHQWLNEGNSIIRPAPNPVPNPAPQSVPNPFQNPAPRPVPDPFPNRR